MDLSSLTPQQYKLWITLTVSYTLQGIILGSSLNFLNSFQSLPSLQIQLLIGMLPLGYTIKLFFAPFCQLFHLKSLGKRCTYIYLGFLLVIFLSFLSAFLRSSLQTLLYSLIVVGIANAVADIGLDSIAAQEFKEPSIGSGCQSIGMQLGIFLGKLLIVKLTSKKFGQSLGFEQGIVDIWEFQILIGVAGLFVLSMWVLLTQKEKTKQQCDSIVLIEQLKKSILPQNMLTTYFLLSFFCIMSTEGFIVIRQLQVKSLLADSNLLSNIQLVVFLLSLIVRYMFIKKVKIQLNQHKLIFKITAIIVVLHVLATLLIYFYQLSLLYYIAALTQLFISPLLMVNLYCCNSLRLRIVKNMKLISMGVIVTASVALSNLAYQVSGSLFTLSFNWAGVLWSMVLGVSLLGIFLSGIRSLTKNRLKLQNQKKMQ